MSFEKRLFQLYEEYRDGKAILFQTVHSRNRRARSSNSIL